MYIATASRLAGSLPDRVMSWPPTTDERLVARDIMLLRLQALLARARGDTDVYSHAKNRYRDMARMLEFDGHIAWADAMP